MLFLGHPQQQMCTHTAGCESAAAVMASMWAPQRGENWALPTTPQGKSTCRHHLAKWDPSPRDDDATALAEGRENKRDASDNDVGEGEGNIGMKYISPQHPHPAPSGEEKADFWRGQREREKHSGRLLLSSLSLSRICCHCHYPFQGHASAGRRKGLEELQLTSFQA